MFSAHTIDSLDMPELEPYRTMRRPLEHFQKGIFVAEGHKVVQRLLASKFEVLSVLMPKSWLPAYEPILQRRPEHIHVYLVDEKRQLEIMTGFNMFQGVLAVGRIPHQPTIEEFVRNAPTPKLFVALDGLTNAENVGVIVRSSLSLGAHGLIAGEKCASPFLRRAVRNSMGAIFSLPVIEPPNLIETLHKLRELGVKLYAAHPHATYRKIWDVDFTVDCCIVFGSEGYGLSDAVLAACQEAVAIPMQHGFDSLNVNNAVAVFLYEALRQRLLPPAH